MARLISVGILLSLPLVPLIVRVMPADYHEPVWQLCLILVLSTIPVAYTITLDSFYLLTGRLRVAVWIAVIGFLVATPTSMALTARFPETGAAWGLVVTTSVAIAHFVYVWWYFKRDPELHPSPSEVAA